MARYNKNPYWYAEVVNPQYQPNTSEADTNLWTNLNNAVGLSGAYATSHFTVEKYISGYKERKKNGKVVKDKKGKPIKDPIYSNKYIHPRTIASHNFGVTLEDLPDEAYISKIAFRVKMKANKTDVQFPQGTLCIYGKGYKAKKQSKTRTRDTGYTSIWQNGLLHINPVKKISTTEFNTCDYVIDDDDIHTYGLYTPSDLRQAITGIDLLFNDHPQKEATVYLGWIALMLWFELPTYTLSHDGTQTSSENPIIIRSGDVNYVTFRFSQTTRANGGTQDLKIKVPYGCDLVSYSVSGGTFNNTPTDYSGDKYYDWTGLDCNGKKTYTITLGFKDYTVNKQNIEIFSQHNISKIGRNQYWFETIRGTTDDYDNTIIQVDTNPYKPHVRHRSCFKVSSRATTSQDDTITYHFKNSEPFILESYIDKEGNKQPCITLGSSSTLGLSIGTIDVGDYSFDANEIIDIPITVPEHMRGEQIDVGLSICLLPLSTNDTRAEVWVNPDKKGSVNYKPLPPFEYHIGLTDRDIDVENEQGEYVRSEKHDVFKAERLGFINHRIATELETGAYVLPCRIKEYDALMVESKPHIHMYKWEEIDYIGCVPVEHYHFDPKSTYKDKLLDNHYKNKRYMGKELASDEDISLNIRLHPHQVTTMQGLIDMDKPIPINANHRCFEGDSLNHRGWAEIYGITATKTNEHWYKCDIDVKYLTHNLNTRFKINKGSKSFPMADVPDMLLESSASGVALSGGNQSDDYFMIETDGTYHYTEEEPATDYYLDEDGDKVVFHNSTEEEADLSQQLIEQIESEGYTIIYPLEDGDYIMVDATFEVEKNQRNVFTLDEGQHLQIKSQNTLGKSSRISMEWSSTLLPEFKENAIKRVISLIDSESNLPMFEYEYDLTSLNEIKKGTAPYDEDEDSYLDTISEIECHVIGRAYRGGDYETVINEMIYLPVDTDTSDYEETTDIRRTYGSNITFNLQKGKTLHVVDGGVTGTAINVKNIELEGESYYWESKWVNQNTDGEDSDLVAFIDIIAQDNIYNSQYSDLFGSMYVSPFPVANKKILFTRQAEEGVIYYLQDDGDSEFSYLMQPYYQYHNGVDLRNSAGSSIFNLNYGYKTVYLENGLVSMGINRLNGQMYLRKWDNNVKDYVTLFNFQLNHYDDININSISDDMIELQVSDTLISMYRGHPYVVLKNRGEDINILSKFGKVYAESVNGEPSEYPVYYDLMNTDNLLPMCVGSKKNIDSDCLQVEENILHLEDVTLTVNTIDTIIDGIDNLYTGYEYTLSVTGLNSGKVYFVVDETVVGSYDPSESNGVPYTFNDPKEHRVYAVFEGDDTREYDVSEMHIVNARQIAVPTPPPSPDDPPRPAPPVPPELSGKWELTITKCPSSFKYMDGQEVVGRLTRGGVGASGYIVERVAFTNIFTGKTDADGYIRFKNSYSTYLPKKYKIGFRFFQGGSRVVPDAMREVTVKKIPTEFVLNKKAKDNDGKVSFKLVQTKYNGSKVPCVNYNVHYTLNGKTYTKKTNDYGNINIKLPSGKTSKLKLVYNGTANHTKCDKTYSEKLN